MMLLRGPRISISRGFTLFLFPDVCTYGPSSNNIGAFRGKCLNHRGQILQEVIMLQLLLQMDARVAEHESLQQTRQ